MNTVFIILAILIVIASILLVIVVLLQNGKGDGMASNFVAGNQTFGVRQTADILEKITWGLVAFVLVISIIAAFTTGKTGSDVDVTNKIENTTTNQPSFPTSPVNQAAPSTEAPATQAPASQKPATQK